MGVGGSVDDLDYLRPSEAKSLLISLTFSTNVSLTLEFPVLSAEVRWKHGGVNFLRTDGWAKIYDRCRNKWFSMSDSSVYR